MRLSQKQIFIVLGVIVLAGVVFYFVEANLRSATRPPNLKITVWGVDATPAEMQFVIDAYKKGRSNVEVAYERIGKEQYAEKLLNALAAGRGPDVFEIQNHALPAEQERLAPAPEDMLGLAKLRQLFPTAVEQDFVSDEKVYAVPAYLDTLALIYNKSLLDQAGVTAPPRTWDEFQKIIPALRTVTEGGQITKAAAAIGGSGKTVHVAADLLEVLMMQNGAMMTDRDKSRASFAASEGGSPGLRAFNFYLQFANAASPYFTWTDAQGGDIESFLGGKTAMIFGYYSDVVALKKKSPFLDIGVAPLPQPSSPTGAEVRRVDAPSYRGFAVSRASKWPEWAWDFALSFTADARGAKVYEDALRRPPAHRELIATKLDDPTFGVFARQALTARSWYQVNDIKIGDIISTAISGVLNGQLTPQKALKQAEDQVTQLMTAQ